MIFIFVFRRSSIPKIVFSHSSQIENCQKPIDQNLNFVFLLQGWLKYREKVFNGFESLPECFIDMLQGGNIGKAVVKL